LISADQRNRVGKVLLKEGQQFVGVGQRFEYGQRHEQGGRERPVLIGQGDEHELVTRPNVKMVAFHGELEQSNGIGTTLHEFFELTRLFWAGMQNSM
jgi:hypothetical protein